MAITRVELSEEIRKRVAEFQAELRQLIYGERACPEWGTSFAVLESMGMSVGEELSRQFMAASAGEQGQHIPPAALACEGEPAGHLGPEKRELLTEAGPMTYETPQGYLPKSRRDFFPLEKAQGMAFEDGLSPAVQEQVTRQGTRLHGFEKARDSLRDVGYDLNTKRIERQTERVGEERVAEREAVVEKFQQLTLVEKCSPPPGVIVPDVAAASCDGGRLQTVEASEKGAHGHQYLAADLRVLESEALAEDPEPALPEIFRDERRMGRVVAGISQKIAGTEAPADPDDAARDHARESRVVDAILSEAADHAAGKPSKTKSRRINQPETITREVLASHRQSAAEFGLTMAAYAWKMGLFVAARKAFVGDGQAANWEIWERQFQAYGFVAVLDFIHALTYVYNAAMAGRSQAAGWEVYVRWITRIWQDRVTEVLAELKIRQQELGLPQDGDGDTHPRKVVAKSLTYLKNQQTRINDPEYRRQGLPITSCHIESTIKQMNYRVKGTEMFWTDVGAESLLQLSADLLCDSQPLDQFWTRRAARMTGYRRYARSVT